MLINHGPLLILSTPRIERGFSIMELMVVLAIVAILSMGVGPSFSNLLNRNEVQKVSSDLTITMLLARSEAVRRNQEVIVSSLGSGWHDGWRVVSGAETISTFDAAADGIEISGPASVTFSANGRTESSLKDPFIFKNSNSKIPLQCIFLSTSGKSKTLIDRNGDGECANG